MLASCDTGTGLHRWQNFGAGFTCTICQETLAFDEAKHIYMTRGQRIPAVSEILRPLANTLFPVQVDDYRRQRADIGTRVHRLTLAIDTGQHIDAADAADIIGYLGAYRRFLRDRSPSICYSEQPVVDTDAWYAGTVDRIAIIDGRPWIIDIKTSREITHELYDLQLYAYAAAAKCGDVTLGILQLRPNGTYILEPAQSSPGEMKATWEALLQIYGWVNRKTG